MEAQVYATPIERVYDEACEVKNQALEATAYEVPVTLKHTDMVCICMACACMRACASVYVHTCVVHACVHAYLVYGLCLCT